MTWSQSWHDPLLWLMAQNETATLHYFVSMAECPKCGAKPGESCVTVIAYEPGKPAGKETPHHSPRVKKGHFGWNAYKGACKVDPKIKELEKGSCPGRRSSSGQAHHRAPGSHDSPPVPA